MPALGIDIAGISDISPHLTYVDPARAVAEAVARSLLHPQGKLWWARDRGYDLRQQLHRFLDDLESIRLGVEQEVAKEERVKSSDVSIRKVGNSIVEISVDLVLTQTEADVSFTLSVNLVDGALKALVNT